jgi:transglutaminase-like putative cysteine protease
MDLRMSGLLLVALAVATASLHSLLQGLDWLFASVGTMVIVFGAAAVARAFLRPRWAGPLAGLVAGVVVITLFFGADTALLGVIPTPETFDRFAALGREAELSIAREAIPANVSVGIQFLLCWTLAAIAFVLDVVAIWWRRPALAGIPLLVVITVPSIVLATLADPLFFEFTAVAYLLLIRNRLLRLQPGVAISVGAIAVLGALIVPTVLPPVTPAEANGSGIGLIATNVNPIINLGDDLRRATATRALSYTTTETGGVYLRLTTLESFVGKEWAPVETQPIPGNLVGAIGTAPGLTAAVKTEQVATNVKIANTSGRWLPVPYPPTSISGLSGDWFWEPEALAVRSANSNMHGQKYLVNSLQLEPSSTLLEAAPLSRDNPLAEVPEGLDPIVAATAKQVVGTAATDFDKALALQDWFRGGTFTYSEHTPAQSGFDGSGLDVIVPFLQSKSGYCVHFATTMAVMARTLGIPSRVAVGFLPGKPNDPKAGEPVVYTVSSNDLHAWPELYFKGVGWVRFEPTPGRGSEPTFPVAQAGDPSTTPGSSSSAPPTPAPTTVPRTAPRLPDETTQDGTAEAITPPVVTAVGWASLAVFLLLLVVLAPGAIRIGMRRRRLESIRQGDDSAGRAWLELRESARDLGYDAREAMTPRELSAWLAESAQLPAQAIAALERLRETVEDESYAYPAYTFVGESLADNLGVVLRALRAVTPLPRRLRATFVPATLVDWALGRGVVAG